MIQLLFVLGLILPIPANAIALVLNASQVPPYHISGLQLVRDLGLKNIRQLKPSLASRKVYFYLHRRHADLAKEASKALREMKRDGSYDRLYQEILAPWQTDASQPNIFNPPALINSAEQVLLS